MINQPSALVLQTLRTTLQRESRDLAAYIHGQRWFQSKARRLNQLDIMDVAAVLEDPLLLLVVVQCGYADAPESADQDIAHMTSRHEGRECYLLPLLLQPADSKSAATGEAILMMHHAGKPAILRDATKESEAMLQIVDGIRRGAGWPGLIGTFYCSCTPIGSSVSWPTGGARPLGVEQSNSSVLIDQSFVLKLFRKLEPGIHPDLEIMAFLSSRGTYAEFPRLIGSIEYRSASYSAAAGLLQDFIPNQGDGWSYVLGGLRQLLQKLRQDETLILADPRQVVRDHASRLVGDLTRLGDITGRLHLTLASATGNPSFGADVINFDDVAAWRGAMAVRQDTVFHMIEDPSRRRTLDLPLATVPALQQACRERLASLSQLVDESMLKIRQHGDYHLGQVLKRPGDESFVVLDFEGEPARSLSERRAKASVLKDLAGMLRSFNYAVEALAQEEGSLSDPERAVLSAWEELASEGFLRGYEETVRAKMAHLLPPAGDMAGLLDVFQVDKAVYELGYELNNRPTWAKIPLRALQSLCGLREG
jgi:maltose alpha-D-glucosyltransferase / alpha-amylase